MTPSSSGVAHAGRAAELARERRRRAPACRRRRRRPGDRYALRPDARARSSGRARPPWRPRRRCSHSAASSLVNVTDVAEERVERVLGHLGRLDRHPLDRVGERREQRRQPRRGRARSRTPTTTRSGCGSLDRLAEPQVLRRAGERRPRGRPSRRPSRSSCRVRARPAAATRSAPPRRREERTARARSARTHEVDVGAIVVVDRRVEGDPDDVGLANGGRGSVVNRRRAGAELRGQRARRAPARDRRLAALQAPRRRADRDRRRRRRGRRRPGRRRSRSPRCHRARGRATFMRSARRSSTPGLRSQVVERPQDAVADCQLRPPAERADAGRVEEDERAVADPAALAAGVVAAPGRRPGGR